jgi:hypothetical protein
MPTTEATCSAGNAFDSVGIGDFSSWFGVALPAFIPLALL